MQKMKLQIPTLHRNPAIRLHNIGKRYGDTTAVDTLSIKVMPGETFALFGPSGCGKTSTLRLVAGLEAPDWGEIFLHSALMSSPKMVVPPHKRKIGMVFQDLALWPHMTASQHIDFALPANTPKNNRQKNIADMLNLVQLTQHKSYPRQLSGGERQRLAIARALAAAPQILIMDEPFSNLDTMLKNDLLAELKNLVTRLGITMLYVTHQWQEVLHLADGVAIMAKGKIVSCGSVEEFTDKKDLAERKRFSRTKTNNVIHLEAKP
jgi:iron(III) transport system ATP-binding protein